MRRALAGRPCGGTYNHAWSGGPLTLLSQYAAGIAPTKPGYETYAVLPQMGSLQRILAVVPTVKGTIEATLTQTDDRFTIDVTSPPGAHGELGIPKRPGMKITLSDPSLRPVGEDDRYLRIPLKTGRNQVEAHFSK